MSDVGGVVVHFVPGGNNPDSYLIKSDNLVLISDDADANVGPNLVLYRNSGSPADDDVLGDIKFISLNNSVKKISSSEVPFVPSKNNLNFVIPFILLFIK